ncbi:hypothetical protein ACFOLC_15620 [Lysobacter cavernae]|uniref:Uncharacterized protein n=1 Tax=Lysobacter cavernae TaxID=1685901 RepID=A0ABV7RW81_9GAMM
MSSSQTFAVAQDVSACNAPSHFGASPALTVASALATEETPAESGADGGVADTTAGAVVFAPDCEAAPLQLAAANREKQSARVKQAAYVRMTNPYSNAWVIHIIRWRFV